MFDLPPPVILGIFVVIVAGLASWDSWYKAKAAKDIRASAYRQGFGPYYDIALDELMRHEQLRPEAERRMHDIHQRAYELARNRWLIDQARAGR